MIDNTLITSVDYFLPPLITLYWSLAAGAAIIALLPINITSGFRNAVLLSACRGKLMEIKPPSALGPLSDITVPQKWFSHFYLIASIWNAALLSCLSLSSSITIWITLCLLQLHFIRRLLETVFLMKYPNSARMHILAYIFGLSYYVILSLTILLPTTSSSSNNNGILHTLLLPSLSNNPLKSGSITSLFSMSTVQSTIYTLVKKLTMQQVLGVAVFLAGNVLQLHSHWILAQLSRDKGRRTSNSNSSSSRYVYKIPKGGAFSLVSCPHYLAEIIIYIGLVMIQQGRGHSWLVLVWVIANLVLAADKTHSWYHETFTRTYPKGRKALVPFVF